MNYLLIILLLFAQTFANEDLSFDQWESKHGIKFNNRVERNYRKKIFLARKAKIEEHNANPANTYKKALNKFSHLESEEFINSKCKTILPSNLVHLTSSASEVTPMAIETMTSSYPFGNYTSSNAPNSVDFRFLMEPVQDQARCGACWAFATMGQLEGMMRIKNPSYNTVLGPQYLVDCDTYDLGCSGGWPSNAMNWLKSNGNNAPSMASYPYKGSQGTCKAGISKISLGIKTFSAKNFAGNEGALKAQIANYGPQVVAIYVTPNFQSYSKGVFYDATCPSGTLNCNNVNHAVIVTGYGTDPVYGDYWQIKNSWSPRWGENGYIRLARNKNNNCNVACWPMFSY